MTTRNHHYVWRHYLEAWGNESGLVHWSKDGEVRSPTNPTNLMVERDYNKLPLISSSDLAFLRLLFESTGSAELRQTHRIFIDDLAHIVQTSEVIQSGDRFSAGEKRLAQAAVVETMEDLHTQIEQSALSILKELRHKRTDFINDYDSSMAFFRFIAHQYLRTRRIREDFEEVHSQVFLGHDFARLAPIVSHIGAENFGASLFVDRNDFDIVFLEGRDDIRFITGDQPVVNLMGDGYGGDTTELSLYYPLSPNLSCLVSPKEYRLGFTEVPDEIVQNLNDFLAWRSKRFLVADSNLELQRVASKPPPHKPPIRRIVDCLVRRP